jgi:hypothetical protein
MLGSDNTQIGGVVSIELAVALSAIATKAAVTQLIQGGPMSRGDWAGVAGQIVETVINTSARQESGIQRLGQDIDKVSQQISEIPTREFDQHMAAGRRYLRDLPAAWRTDEDRRELIRDARAEFVQAVAIAELGNDLQRQALAEVAVAGCWLWVPSIDDVRNAAGQARRLLEREILFANYPWPRGIAPLVGDYIDAVTLCKAYGERSAQATLPMRRSRWGRLTVNAALDQWIECSDIWVRVSRDQQPEFATPPSTAATKRGTPQLPSTPGDPPIVLKVTVHNKRASSVMVSFAPTAARISIADAHRSPFLKILEWSSLAPGEVTTRRIKTADPSGGDIITIAGTQQRWVPLEPGLLAFLYPAQP